MKEQMQRFILPDYISGKATSKKDKYLGLKIYASATGLMEVSGSLQFKFTNNPEKIKKIQEDIPLKVDDLIDLIRNDESALAYVRSWIFYTREPHQNYLFSKPLVDSLLNTKSDVKVRYLPSEFNAYIELPGLKDHEGDRVIGIFVNIHSYAGIRELCVSFILEREGGDYDVNVGHLLLHLEDEDATLRDYIGASEFLRNEPILKENGKMSKKQKVFEGEYGPYHHAIIHAILFIQHMDCGAEIRNDFSLKKKKNATQRKIYTSESFHLPGISFQMPKTYSIDSTMVSGHWRWQPYGPERSLLKHIYINPHERHYNKKGQNIGCSTTSMEMDRTTRDVETTPSKESKEIKTK